MQTNEPCRRGAVWFLVSLIALLLAPLSLAQQPQQSIPGPFRRKIRVTDCNTDAFCSDWQQKSAVLTSTGYSCSLLSDDQTAGRPQTDLAGRDGGPTETVDLNM